MRLQPNVEVVRMELKKRLLKIMSLVQEKKDLGPLFASKLEKAVAVLDKK